jgi:vacuolar protein sorting-associated protein 8
VVFKWERPAAAVAAGNMPCITWNWMPEEGKAGNKQVPVLARCWGRNVQMLGCRIARDTSLPEGHSLTFEPLHEVALEQTTLALEWIGNGLLAVLEADNNLRVLDVPALSSHDVINIASVQLLVLSITPAGPSSSSSSPDQVSPTSGERPPVETYQNSFRRGDGRLYLLGKKELRVVGLQSWSQRIEAFVEVGEWLEALALALDHYETEVVSKKAAVAATQQQQKGVPGLGPVAESPMRPTMLTPTEGEIADLLLRYVKLAIENAPKSGTSSLSRSHFQMLSGVCIEYCLVTNRLDLLYGEIFNRFVAVGQVRTFLDMLEPYVLNDRLRYMGPEVLLSLIEHCQDKRDLPTVERCLLHMDVTELDFDHVLTVLLRHKLFSGLVHVYTRGLSDFLRPLQQLLQEVVQLALDFMRKERQHEQDPNEDEAEGAAAAVAAASDPEALFRREGALLEALGLKTLLYLTYCFQGKAFPSGEPLPEPELASLANKRSGIMSFLLSKRVSLPDDSFVPASDLDALGTHGYIRILVALETKALLDVIAMAFDSEDVIFESEMNGGREMARPAWKAPGPESSGGQGQPLSVSSVPVCPSREEICDLLLGVVAPQLLGPAEKKKALESDSSSSLLVRKSQSAEAVATLMDFLAVYMERGHVPMRSPVVCNAVLRHLTSPAATDKLGRDTCQERMVKLLQRMPADLLNIPELLPLTRATGFSRAQLFLHETAYHMRLLAVMRNTGGAAPAPAKDNHLACAMECYLADQDPDFQRRVFEYLSAVIAQVQSLAPPSPSLAPASSDKGLGLGDRESPLLGEVKRTILQMMSGLFRLDCASFLRLTGPLFSGDSKAVLEALEATGNQELQFQYLHAIVAGDLQQGGAQEADAGGGGGGGGGAAQVVAAMGGGGAGGGAQPFSLGTAAVNLTSQDLVLYVRLMARFRPAEVYNYVKTHDNYPLDECLRICQQERKLMDATAYLLERTGDVLGALQMLLAAITERVATLRSVIRRFNTRQFTAFLSTIQQGSSAPAAPVTLTPALLRRKGLIRKVVFENMEEGKALEKILLVALDLCQRNSARAADVYDEEVARLWFALLDRLLNEHAATKVRLTHPTALFR